MISITKISLFCRVLNTARKCERQLVTVTWEHRTCLITTAGCQQEISGHQNTAGNSNRLTDNNFISILQNTLMCFIPVINPFLYQFLHSFVVEPFGPLQRTDPLRVLRCGVSPGLQESSDHFIVSGVNCPEESTFSGLRRRLQLSSKIYQTLRK